MKQTLTPALQLSLKTTFHHNKAKALQILSYSNEELRLFLQEQGYHRQGIPTISEVTADAYLAYDHQQTSLYDEIMNQVQLSKYPLDPSLCDYLLLQLDGNGYFTIPYAMLIKQAPYSKEQITYHLKVLRSFEPLGCFAFSLKQCLQIQCRYAMEPASETAYLLCTYLDELANHEYQKILERTQLSEDEFEEGYHFLTRLQPKPAASYQQGMRTMTPEFVIQIQEGQLMIQPMQDELSLILQEDEGSQVSEYLKKQRQETNVLLDHIRKRNMTLLQIMQVLCDVQRDFFLHGESLHPLQMTDIANVCGLHCSTISRALMNKSFEFQQRYYAMSELLTHGGNANFSPDEIKKELIALIQKEDKQAPLSDEQLRHYLEEQGIIISRRAIGKYRQSAGIANSTKRKKL